MTREIRGDLSFRNSIIFSCSMAAAVAHGLRPTLSTMSDPMQEYREPAEDVNSDLDAGDESDDDPIVKRIPVFYTPHYLSSLTLLQYPDRAPRPHTQHPLLPPSLRPGADPAPDPARSRISARYKPKSQHLQVEIPLERDPERWSEFEAAKFAKGLPEKEREKEKKTRGRKAKKDEEAEQEARLRLQEERDARRLDRIMFSSLVVPDVTNYLVGVVKDGQSSPRRARRHFSLRRRPADSAPPLQTRCTSPRSHKHSNYGLRSTTSTRSSRTSAGRSATARRRTTRTRTASFRTRSLSRRPRRRSRCL